MVSNIGVDNINFAGATSNIKSSEKASKPIQANFPIESKDVLDLSSKKKTKTEGVNLAKWAIGIAALLGTIYAGVVTRRIKTKPKLEKCAQNFSEIFRRNVSNDEAQKLLDKYKDILKIKDDQEFCKKAFEQVKKDYGYENIDIKLEFLEKLDKVAAGWNSHDGSVILFLKNNKLPTKKMDLINSLMHEFQHIKQTEMAYRTNPEKYLSALQQNHSSVIAKKMLSYNDDRLGRYAKQENMSLNEFKEMLIKIKNGEDKETILKVSKNSLGYFDFEKTKEITDKMWSGKARYNADSEEYKLGEKYIENFSHYIDGLDNLKEYKEQILEKEAYNVSHLTKEICKYISNPWRIFG